VKPLPQHARFRRPGVTFQQKREVQQRIRMMLIEIERLAIPRFRIGRAIAGIAHEAEQETHFRRGTVLAQIDIAAFGRFFESSLIRKRPRIVEFDRTIGQIRPIILIGLPWR
jgi:hypothetical protein